MVPWEIPPEVREGFPEEVAPGLFCGISRRSWPGKEMEGGFQAERHRGAKKGVKAGEDLGLSGNCMYSA